MNTETDRLPTTEAPWIITLRAAAALAAAMGVGRFAYTPILPLMEAQAGLSASAGASVATANYVGYLAGALVGIVAPALLRSRTVLRGSLVALVASLALMPVLTGTVAWAILRLVAGVASALVFVVAAGGALARLRAHARHLGGWVFGGVGGGIALSGMLVLALRTTGDWQHAWWACAGVTAVLGTVAWRLAPEPAPAASLPQAASPSPSRTRWFVPLWTAYTLEGIGYIIAGTFLVAAIEDGVPGPLGAGAWILVGLAALPSCAVWARLSHRWSGPTMLCAALLAQSVGIALPAFARGPGPALIAAVLFGATFMGVTTLTLAAGRHLSGPRAIAVLTAGYSTGQILGPALAAPLLDGGYGGALLLAGALVLAAAVSAAAGALRFPRLAHPSA